MSCQRLWCYSSLRNSWCFPPRLSTEALALPISGKCVGTPTLCGFLGRAGALGADAIFPDPLLLDTALTLGIASGILLGVALAQISRTSSEGSRGADSDAVPPEQAEATADDNTTTVAPASQKAVAW